MFSKLGGVLLTQPLKETMERGNVHLAKLHVCIHIHIFLKKKTIEFGVFLARLISESDSPLQCLRRLTRRGVVAAAASTTMIILPLRSSLQHVGLLGVHLRQLRHTRRRAMKIDAVSSVKNAGGHATAMSPICARWRQIPHRDGPREFVPTFA